MSWRFSNLVGNMIEESVGTTQNRPPPPRSSGRLAQCKSGYQITKMPIYYSFGGLTDEAHAISSKQGVDATAIWCKAPPFVRTCLGARASGPAPLPTHVPPTLARPPHPRVSCRVEAQLLSRHSRSGRRSTCPCRTGCAVCMEHGRKSRTHNFPILASLKSATLEHSRARHRHRPSLARPQRVLRPRPHHKADVLQDHQLEAG